MEQYKKETMLAYDGNPKQYTEQFLRNVEEYSLADLDLFSHHLKGKKILDVGCGPGGHLEWFREHGLDALGIDISDAFLAECTAKGLNVRKMDMENPILWPKSFDGIWANSSLLHIPKNNLGKTIAGLARLLKPTGIFWLVVTEGAGEGYSVEDASLNHKRWFSLYSVDELEKYLQPYTVLFRTRDTANPEHIKLKYLFQPKS